MRVLGESWCFCAGGGRSERMKGSVFSAGAPAMASVGTGTGFLIHRGLLLTTHANIPSVAAAEAAPDVRLPDRVSARLVPHRFFITSSVLDLTIVGLDTLDGDSASQNSQSHYLKICSNPTLDLGSVVYLLGHTEKKELTVGEGKIVIATDNLIKLSTDGIIWSPGSAGFDVQGNLAFMVCDPMKLASSPTARSSTSSSSSSSWKKDLSMQFGIPIPIICDWLNQHWEANLDDLTKPKLPIMRLMSTGQRSEHSCASFTLRRVFKSAEGENDDNSLSSQPRSGCIATGNTQHEGNPLAELRSSHERGIPTPEIYESPRLTAGLLLKKENTHPPLLDINFPPRASRSVAFPLAIKQLLPDPDEKLTEKPVLQNPASEESLQEETGSFNPDEDNENLAVRSVTAHHSEVHSSSSPIEVSELQNLADRLHANYSSEEETMYSAETMESRNYTSPREGRFQQVKRSQSCVNYSRWSAAQRNPATGRGALEKQRSLAHERKTHSQAAVSQRTRSHDYFSPTVSSIMKKKNSSEQLPRARQNAVQLSTRWLQKDVSAT